jgi:hypothetical protein
MLSSGHFLVTTIFERMVFLLSSIIGVNNYFRNQKTHRGFQSVLAVFIKTL